MIKESLITLLTALESTNSYSEKLNHFYQYVTSEKLSLADPAVEQLVKMYQFHIEKKKKQGSVGGTVTSQTKANVKKKNKETKTGFSRPIFVTDYKYKPEDICCQCKKPLNSSRVFRWRQDGGGYDNYHCTIDCFPLQHSHLFTQNYKYQKEMMPKTENDHDQDNG